MSFLTININAAPVQLSRNFNSSEIVGASHPIEGENIILLDSRLIDIAQYIRDALGTPIKVNSAYRSPKYNASLRGSASNSQHIKGRALDLSGNGIVEFLETAYRTNNEHGKALYAMGLRGIGFYDWGAHIDTREQNRVSKWDYRKKKSDN
jgi:hypothetical protein